MALVDVDIEDYLDEVDTRFLIRELERRKKSGQLNKDYDDIIDELEIQSKWPDVKTLVDEQKREWVKANWDKIPI